MKVTRMSGTQPYLRGLQSVQSGQAPVGHDHPSAMRERSACVALREFAKERGETNSRKLADAGVCLLGASDVFVEPTVRIGAGSIIYPGTFLLGQTEIGANCRLGPNTIIVDSTVGDKCNVIASMVEGATLEDDVHVGPYSHVSQGCHLEREVYIGNFAELIRSRIGQRTRICHFAYIGDAIVGPDVNIGAGTVTCNFDGVKKVQTIIEEGVFIGSGTMLVAPVKAGALAMTGAGSVVTRDVAPGVVAFGVPAKPRQKRS